MSDNIIYFKGKPINEDMSKEELIEIVKFAVSEIKRAEIIADQDRRMFRMFSEARHR